MKNIYFEHALLLDLHKGKLLTETLIKKKLGIIGGGASGLVCAWLLEEQYEITLFETSNTLGGHACTLKIPLPDDEFAFIDAGAEFFSDPVSPEFNRLLQALKVQKNYFSLTYTFYNTITGKAIALPPYHDKSLAWSSCTPPALFDMLLLHHWMHEGRSILASNNTHITLGEFVESLTLTSAFKDHFLYPLFASNWGVTIEDIKKFAAYDVLAWAIKNNPSSISPSSWFEIIGGTSAYINALIGQLKSTIIKPSTLITALSYANGQYTTIDTQGNKSEFDSLILATNAFQAKDLLKDIPQKQQLCHALAAIKYFYTTIAIHSDMRLMPSDKKNWAVANIAFNDIHSALTIYKPWKSSMPLFRSWITYPINLPNNSLPEPLYTIKHFFHPHVTPAYFQAQKELAPLQGKDNLWIAGFYTTGIDAHNSAILSAMHIAQNLAPKNPRLKKLLLS